MKKLFVLTMSVILAASTESRSQALRIAASENKQGNANAGMDVRYNGVPLEDALRDIATRAGLKLTYARNILPAGTRVSFSASGINAEQALANILRGSGLQAVMLGGNRITIVRQGAKSPGTITGRVTDTKTGRGLNGANVSVDGGKGVATGEDGTYRLTNIAAGTHTVQARLLGYAKQSRTVSVGEGQSATLDFKLEQGANVLDQVVVTGTVVQSELKSVPNAITVITAKQIEERGITRIEQLFRGDVPGLFALNMGSNALLDEVTMFSRGATALPGGLSAGTDPVAQNTNTIKTYIDGIEMVNSKYISQIDPNSIERIEILTGPQASTIYGSNAINGVMQIFTKRGSGSKPQLTASLNSGVIQNNFNSRLAPLHTADSRLSGVEGRISYSTAGSINYVGAWIPSKQTQRLTANGGMRSDFRKLTLDISSKWAQTRNRRHGNQLQGNTNLLVLGTWLPSNATGLAQPQTAVIKGQGGSLTVSYRPLHWWSQELGIGYDESHGETVAHTPGFTAPFDTTRLINNVTSSLTTERYSTTVQIPVSSLFNVSLVVGGDHWRNRGSSWSALPVSLTGNLTGVSVVRSKPGKNGGAFFQGQFGVKDELFFTYGLRAEWNPNYGDDARVLPGRYGVSYARDVNTPLGIVSAKIRGSYGRSTRPPAEGLKQSIAATTILGTAFTNQFGQFEYRLGNPDLLPEHQQGGEGGVELYFGSRASLIVSRYNQTVDNLIASVYPADSVRSLMNTPSADYCDSEYTDANGYCYYYQYENINVGSIRNQGWELQSSFGFGPITARGTYSWTKSRVIGITPRYNAAVIDPVTGTGFQVGRPFDYLPEHTWALGMTYAQPSTTISLSVNGIGTLYKGGDNVMLSVNNRVRLANTRPRINLPATYRPLGPGYATADINANHRFTARTEGTIQITNLTNYYQNDSNTSYASIGRQTKLGVRVRLN